MNIPVLATLGIVTTILVFVIIVATQAWFRYEFQHEYDKKVVSQRNVWLDPILEAQRAALQNGPVPIDQAMSQVVEQYGQAQAEETP